MSGYPYRVPRCYHCNKQSVTIDAHGNPLCAEHSVNAELDKSLTEKYAQEISEARSEEWQSIQESFCAQCPGKDTDLCQVCWRSRKPAPLPISADNANYLHKTQGAQS